MSELPNGWQTASIANVTNNHDGQRVPVRASDRQGRQGQYPYYGASGIIDSVNDYLFDGEYLLIAEDGANLLARSTPIAFQARGKFWVNNHAHVVTANEATSHSYLEYYLNSIDLAPFVTGSAQPKLTQKALNSIPVPLAPVSEQTRIVSKLDSLRARSGRARQELDHIPKLIERYKQAILAKAFSGELTKDWREQHPTIGTGADALTKIDAARNALLEGRAPARRGPVSDGEAGRIPVELPELPATWGQTSLEMITSPVRLIQYGILKPGDDVPGGVPYVKVMNIQGGNIRLDKIRRTTTEIHRQYRRSAISTGDILLSIRGTVGRLAFVPPELDGGNITQDSVRIDVLPSMNARFVYWYLHSPTAQEYFARNQKGVAVRGINVGDVRPMEIPIPPEGEQARIVTLVENALAWLNKIAIEHARTEDLLPKLDQAILAKAFRGELVPQDPNDEPASVLLERIKAERNGGTQTIRRAAKA